jgi:LysR family transcriptional regulator of beta-lactamase
VFDSSILMVAMAESGLGVALAPPAMFVDHLVTERLVQPFAIEIDTGSYWLTRLKSRQETPAMRAFAAWIADEVSTA